MRRPRLSVPMPHIGAASRHFWFERRSTETLSLVRIFFGITLFMKITDFDGLSRIGKLHMDFPHHAFATKAEYFFDAFRMPMPGFGWLPVPSFGQYQALEALQLLLCIAFIAGLWVRWVGPILTLSLLYPLLLSQFMFRHHVLLFVLALAILSVSGCADHFGVGAYVKGDQGGRPLRPILPLRLLQVLVTFVYLFSAIGKTNGGWGGGLVLSSLDAIGQLEGPFKRIILAVVPLLALSIATVVIEWVLVVGLWMPNWRRHVIAAGVLLHLGIDAIMYVDTFGYQMMALYIAFLAPETGRTVAFYHGRSPTCGRWRRGTALLDWLRRVTWVDLYEGAWGTEPSVQDEPFTVQSSNGEVYRGFAAWRRLHGSFPVTFLPAYLLHLPGLSHLGSRLYGRAATRSQAK